MTKRTINLPTPPQRKLNFAPYAYELQNIRLQNRELQIPLMREFGGWDGLSYSDFEEMLDAFNTDDYDTIRLNIHSGGGDVWVGVGIYNRLASMDAEVIADIPGLAASAASVVAMSADKVRIGSAARFMIHRAWTVAMGNADEMRDAAAMLETIDEDIAGIYADRTGKQSREIMAMMERETWLNGDEAIKNGFADELMPKPNTSKPKPKSEADKPFTISALNKWLKDNRRKK